MSDDLVSLFQLSSFTCQGDEAPSPRDGELSPIPQSPSGDQPQVSTGEPPPSTQFADEDTSAAYHNFLTEEFESNDVRIAMIGNVDSGKSTLIGVLTNSTLDDGRGAARSSVLKHRHEQENGEI